MLKANAICSESVNIGSFVVLRAVAGEALPRDIIGHNENNVGFPCRKRGGKKNSEEKKLHEDFYGSDSVQGSLFDLDSPDKRSKLTGYEAILHFPRNQLPHLQHGKNNFFKKEAANTK
jgi:hypothetical protein